LEILPGPPLTLLPGCSVLRFLLLPAPPYRQSLSCYALKNPVFWAPVLGFVIASIKFHMPIYLEKSLTILGAALRLDNVKQLF
jgi:hypothetical protein